MNKRTIIAVVLNVITCIIQASAQDKSSKDMRVIQLQQYDIDSSFVKSIIDTYQLTTQREATDNAAMLFQLGRRVITVYEIPDNAVNVLVSLFYDSGFYRNKIVGISYSNGKTILLTSVPYGAEYLHKKTDFVCFPVIPKLMFGPYGSFIDVCVDYSDTYGKKILYFACQEGIALPSLLAVNDYYKLSNKEDIDHKEDSSLYETQDGKIITNISKPESSMIERINELSSKTDNPLEIGSGAYGYYFNCKMTGGKSYISIDRFHNIGGYLLPKKDYRYAEYGESPLFFSGDFDSLLENTLLEKRLSILQVEDIFECREENGIIILPPPYYECTHYDILIDGTEMLIDCMYAEC